MKLLAIWRCRTTSRTLATSRSAVSSCPTHLMYVIWRGNHIGFSFSLLLGDHLGALILPSNVFREDMHMRAGL